MQGDPYGNADRVIVRVHHNTTVVRALAQPATTAGFTVALQVVVGVGNLTDGGAAGHEHHAGLAGRQTEHGVGPFAGGELRERTGGTGHSGALAGTELDAVHEGTNRNFAEREAVADFRSDAAAGGDHLAYLESFRSDDISLLSVFVLNQGDAGAAVRIILDGLHSLVTATDVTHGHLTGVVTTAGALERLTQ